jgi:iron complex transport system substrate-binding protein
MRHILKLLLLGCALCATSACHQTPSNQGNVSASNCQTVQHEVGETQVCDRPQRIVALNPKMLDILLSLDVQPVGYAEVFPIHRGEFDRPSQQIPYLGNRITQPIANLGASSEPSLEAIARLNPDLILGDSGQNENEYAQLSQIAPTLLFEYVGHDKWQEPLSAIAQVLGRERQAQAVIETHRQQVEATRQALAPVVKAYPKVLMLASEQLTQSLELVTSADFCGGLLEDLGFQLVSLSSDQPKSIIQPISVEILPQLDSNLIFVQGHDVAGFSQMGSAKNLENNQLQKIQQAWRSNTIAQSLSASQANRVYFIPTYICRAIPSPTGAQLALKQLQRLSTIHSTVRKQLL